MAQVNGLIVGISVLLSGVSAVLITPIIADVTSSIKRMVRIRGELSGVGHAKLSELLLSDFCTNGIAVLRVPARLLSALPPYAEIAREVTTVLSVRYRGCNARAMAETLLAFCLLSGLALLLLSGQMAMALLGVLASLIAVQVKAHKWLHARRNSLREQLPDALRGLGMCFMAGLRLEQAFDQTAQECREPLKQELSRTVDDLRTGSSIMEALDGLDDRLAMDEMRFVSVALEIQHRTGGSMREVLEAAADSMLASFDLSRSLEVQTAQARLSARIVSLLPLVLVAVLSLTMEGYLASFFSSPAGFFLLLCAVTMQVAGIVIIRRILGIDLR